MSSRPFKKNIWMLWLQGEENAPELVKQCIESWRFHNPDWQFNVLSRVDVDALWTTDREKDVAARMPESALANLARMKLLITYGGVWADVTLACTRPLDTWMDAFFAGKFFAFCNPPEARPVENFFLVAGKEDPLMVTWMTASLDLWSQPSVMGRDPVDKCMRWYEEMSDKGRFWRDAEAWENIKILPYYWHHYIFDYLLANNEGFSRYWKAVPKCTAYLPSIMDLKQAFDETQCDDKKFEGMLTQAMTPMHKLNWRRMDPATMPRVQRLLDHCCGRG